MQEENKNIIDAEIEEKKDSDMNEKDRTNHGLRKILSLIILAVIAGTLIYMLQLKNDNTIKKENKILQEKQGAKQGTEQEIKQEKKDKDNAITKTLEENKESNDDLNHDINGEDNQNDVNPEVNDANTANSLGSIVNEKIDLSNYKENHKDIQSVYRVYDMSLDENGYLVKVNTKINNKNRTMAVIFDNSGEKVLSVRFLNSIVDTGVENEDALNHFIDSLYNTKPPIAVIGSGYKDSKVEDPSLINEIKGGVLTSKAIIRGINIAYEFLKNVIIHSDVDVTASIFR